MSLMIDGARILFLPKNSRHGFFRSVLNAAKDHHRWHLQVVCDQGAKASWVRSVSPAEFFIIPDFTQPQDWEKDERAARELDEFIGACELECGTAIGQIALAGERDLGRGYSLPAYYWFHNRLANAVLRENTTPNLVIRRMFAFARATLRSAKPDFVISGEWADPLCFVFSMAGRKMGICCVSFRPSKLWSGRGYWTTDPLMYNVLTLQGCAERIERSAPVSERAQAKLSEFRRDPTTLQYVQKNWSDREQRNWWAYHLTLAKVFALRASHIFGFRTGQPPRPAFQLLLEHYRRPVLRARQRRFFHRLTREQLQTQRYILLALHKDPEQALNYQAPFWSNQINTISFLSGMLPSGYLLLVREHRLNTGRRPMSYYRELANLPGVMLIDAFDSQFKYIANADLVVTDNGSTGWEALMLGRKVLTVADHFFKGAALDHRVFDVNTMAETVIDLLNKPEIHDLKKRDHKLGWLLDSEWENTTPMEPLSPSHLLDLLAKVLPRPQVQHEPLRSALAG